MKQPNTSGHNRSVLSSGSGISFYLMNKDSDFHPGVTPPNPAVEIAGLKQAIHSTRSRIREYKADNADTSEFDFHLKKLDYKLKMARSKLKIKA